MIEDQQYRQLVVRNVQLTVEPQFWVPVMHIAQPSQLHIVYGVLVPS